MSYNKETYKKYIKKLKDNELCIKCKKPLDRNGVHCVQCRKIINENVKLDRDFYRENRTCPRCRKNTLVGNERICLECTANEYEQKMNSNKRLGKEHLNKIHSDWEREERKKRIENGMCTRCGKRKVDSGYKTCGICRDKRRRYISRKRTKKISRGERANLGLCYFCENPLKDGYKVCEYHYNQNVKYANCENAKTARKKLIKEGIIW